MPALAEYMDTCPYMRTVTHFVTGVFSLSEIYCLTTVNIEHLIAISIMEYGCAHSFLRQVVCTLLLTS